MKRLICALAVLGFTVLIGSPVSTQTQSAPTIAVLDFEFGSVQKWWSGNQDIGKGISDMLVDELVNAGGFRVIERKALDAIIAEQNLSNSNRAEPGAKEIAQIGKLLGVKYLVVGSVTKFGTEQSSTRIGGGAFGTRYGVGNVGTSKGKASVGITARIIDTSTGEIMASAKGDGTSKRSGLLLGGSIEFGSSDFRDTILGEATDEAVKATAAKLVAAKGRL